MRARSAASPSGGNSADVKSIAVLPIENLGGDSTTEYLADGMTGELSSALTKIPGLQVTPDLSAGKLVWSNAYDRTMKDNFAMQDEITGAIASEMRVVLTRVALAVERAGRTENAESHDLFMRGQFEKNKLTPEGLSRAVVYFQDALKLDPQYARAYAGLAFAYDMQADFMRRRTNITHLCSRRRGARCRSTAYWPRRAWCMDSKPRQQTGTPMVLAQKWNAGSR